MRITTLDYHAAPSCAAFSSIRCCREAAPFVTRGSYCRVAPRSCQARLHVPPGNWPVTAWTRTTCRAAPRPFLKTPSAHATETGVKIPTRTRDQDVIDSPRAVGHCRPMMRAGLHIPADISVPDKNVSSQASPGPSRGAQPPGRGHVHARAVRERTCKTDRSRCGSRGKMPLECCGYGGQHLRLIVDKKQDRLVQDLWSRQGRVRCVCHADRQVAAIVPQVQ
jgi:hypothetical protein